MGDGKKYSRRTRALVLLILTLLCVLIWFAVLNAVNVI